ncbi:MAG: beta galactosidase jelly roll domain-containing protein, partial [Caldilinea sp.]|nr:beta galactosidase jelly roll domain-containing protein [Caldilinea sp.]MDW8440873.1 glycoside hydrolase family 2 TIM barrel-domain containing protein [Caldilineaceae bacterium]
MTNQTFKMSLDGLWDFQVDPAGGDDVASIREWRTARVPAPWQAQFDDLRHYSGIAWYRRRFDWQGDLTDKAAILHFGAADYHAVVWLNGQRIGEHEGGYLPFEFDVAAGLRTGENVLVVRVADPDDDRSRFPAFPFSEIPHGKQSGDGPIGGLRQSVWLEVRPALHLVRLRLTPLPAERAIEIQALLSAALPPSAEVRAAVRAPDGRRIAETALDATGAGRIVLNEAPLLWSPETPHLYTVEAAIMLDGAVHHRLAAACGFRTVEAKNGRIYLNGEPIYLRGALDQAYYPETIYTPPSLEFLEDQARKAKALGLNCLRTHIKIEDPRYYDVADRLGLLIWTEIPNWVLLTEAADRRIKETFRAMVERDWNHPSIIAWTLVNENWGTDLPRNPEHRHWLADFYHYAKTVDPTRLIVDNSACCDNFHVAGDLEDFHHYRAIPDHAAEWDAWVADFASRANDWVWARDYLHERRADLPLLVSEFGNWGLPDPAAIQEKGRDPWWFETGHEWGEGIVYPHGMPLRFRDHGLESVFGSFQAFIQASQEHMARSLHYEITTMRLHPAIAGYVITEFTDVHWECNGLLTMQRHVKQGLATILTPLNQDNVVALRPRRWSGCPGDSLPVEVRCFGVDGERNDGVIFWRIGDYSGQLPAPGGVVQAPLAAPGMARLEARWLTADGQEIASNVVELACVSPPRLEQRLCIVDDPTLAEPL